MQPSWSMGGRPSKSTVTLTPSQFFFAAQFQPQLYRRYHEEFEGKWRLLDRPTTTTAAGNPRGNQEEEVEVEKDSGNGDLYNIYGRIPTGQEPAIDREHPPPSKSLHVITPHMGHRYPRAVARGRHPLGLGHQTEPKQPVRTRRLCFLSTSSRRCSKIRDINLTVVGIPEYCPIGQRESDNSRLVA